MLGAPWPELVSRGVSPPLTRKAGRPLRVIRRGSARILARFSVRSACRKPWKLLRLLTMPKGRLAPPVVVRSEAAPAADVAIALVKANGPPKMLEMKKFELLWAQLKV